MNGNHDIMHNGQAKMLLASCLGDGDTGGGLFAFDGSALERVDRIACTGLFVDGDRLFRLLRSSDSPDSVGEMLAYDERGISRYYRIDDLTDAHDVIWDGHQFIAVSTLSNRLLWIDSSGVVTRDWQAPGTGDAWHLNSLLIHDDRLFVSAFGRFEQHREWSRHPNIHSSGMVFDLETGRDILTGLSCPHHPRVIDGAWIVCNSGNKELVEMDLSTGAVRRRLPLNGWTRGIAVTDDYLFVGESANRKELDQGQTAGIAIICRKTWNLIDRITLPCREVYDLVFVSPSLLRGVQRGFRTNAQRVAERDQFHLLDAVGVEPKRVSAMAESRSREACRLSPVGSEKSTTELGKVLVTFTDSGDEAGLLLMDLDAETFKVLLPHSIGGGVYTGPDFLLAARRVKDKTRLEKYDREGLVWMRRVRDCVDTHSLTVVGNEIAICTTGLNQVIFLDNDGRELRRWSPDPDAEGDSWHINSLISHEGRLFVTCFGRFSEFRGWNGKIDGSGMLMEVGTGRVLLENLSAPHDPRPVDGGWIVNNAYRSQTVFYPADGEPRLLAQVSGFARGLLVLPTLYVVGSSAHRLGKGDERHARVCVVERKSGQVIKQIPIPYREIGHIVLPPSSEILQTIEREQAGFRYAVLPQRESIPDADRQGSLTIVGPAEPIGENQQALQVRVRVTNRGGRVWSSENEFPVHVGYHLINDQNEMVWREGTRTCLPIPIQPGRSLTFPVQIDLSSAEKAAAAVLTLVQESVAWWEETTRWRPAIVTLPQPGHSRQAA